MAKREEVEELEFVPATECEHGYIKAMFYGGYGSGKTHTMLAIATSIGRTAMIDTERGAEPFKHRFKNPDGTPFGIFETRNMEKVLRLIDKAVERKYECLILDQISSIWDEAQESYFAKEHEKASKVWELMETNGSVPWTSWRHIKRPYKRILKELINAPIHVFIGARKKDEYKPGGGEPVKIGEIPVSEKETPHEPQIVVKMEFHQREREWWAYIEKSRWLDFQGKIFKKDHEKMFAEILPLLGKQHGTLPQETEDLSEISVENIPANEPQKILLRKLGEKGGIANIDELIEAISSVEANRWINEATLGRFDSWK